MINGQSFQVNFPAITPAVNKIVENDIFTKPYTCISIQATIAGRPQEVYLERIKGVGGIGNFRNDIKFKKRKKRTMKENFNEETIEALFIVIEEFESNPIGSSNETLLEILSERVETITTDMNKKKTLR